MSVLKIDSSARLTGSNSRMLTHYLTKSLIEKLGKTVVTRDLAQQPLPAINGEDLMGVHASSDNPRASLQQHLTLSNQLIAELMAADTLVIGAPIYNFGIPAVLKQWIDLICRAGITFKYDATGPVGLTGIPRAFIVTSSGGTPVGGDIDYASRYMEHICRFIGVKNVIHIDASGSKRIPELIIAQGKQQIDHALSTLTSETA